MIKRSAIAALPLALAFGTAAHAQTSLPVCTMPDGTAISYEREDDSMAGPFYTYLKSSDAGKLSPVIVYDGLAVAKMAADEQAYVFAHECAHHHLGHSVIFHQWQVAKMPIPDHRVKIMEREADCAAALDLRQKGFSRERIERSMDFLKNHPDQDFKWHDKPAERLQNILKCVAG